MSGINFREFERRRAKSRPAKPDQRHPLGLAACKLNLLAIIYTRLQRDPYTDAEDLNCLKARMRRSLFQGAFQCLQRAKPSTMRQSD